MYGTSTSSLLYEFSRRTCVLCISFIKFPNPYCTAMTFTLLVTFAQGENYKFFTTSVVSATLCGKLKSLFDNATSSAGSYWE